MPADVSARAAWFLHEIIKDAGSSPFIAFEKKDFFAKICFILKYSSPASAWGIIFFLKGGGLLEEKKTNDTIIYKIEIKAAEIFIKKQNVLFENLLDKKIGGVKK